jgi:hypothetical protein
MRVRQVAGGPFLLVQGKDGRPSTEWDHPRFAVADDVSGHCGSAGVEERHAVAGGLAGGYGLDVDHAEPAGERQVTSSATTS